MFIMTSPCSLVLGKKWVHFLFIFWPYHILSKPLFLEDKASFEKTWKATLWIGVLMLARYINLVLNHSMMNNSGGNDWTSVFIENWHFLNMKLFCFYVNEVLHLGAVASVHFTCSVLFKSKDYIIDFHPAPPPPSILLYTFFAQRIFFFPFVSYPTCLFYTHCIIKL